MSGFSMDLLRFSIVLVIVGIACLLCGKGTDKQFFLEVGATSLFFGLFGLLLTYFRVFALGV